ncbi:MAG TPA: urea ABC transporter permease subunit UrtB [Betaproteobacteria bacterium]|jgi:urea transport system permease protein|nr:urea ABC transporter permease subunit UrtB [Betaproteobacteria bacterium]
MLNNKRNALLFILSFLALAFPMVGTALDRTDISGLASEHVMERLKAIEKIARVGDSDALRLLEGLQNSELLVTDTGQIVLENDDWDVIDAITLEMLDPQPDTYNTVIVNNRMRSQLESAVGVLQLLSDDREIRLTSAKSLRDNLSPSLLTFLNKALAQESDEEIGRILKESQSIILLDSLDEQERIDAVHYLTSSSERRVRELLVAKLEKNESGEFEEISAEVRVAIEFAVTAIDRKLTFIDYFGRLFSGLSLGSILLLAAMGLAITYGLLGVINLAHGEMLMIGAYATYVTQQLFVNYLPSYFDLYVLAAIPMAFLSSAIIGVVLERTVIRWLYGRPLETLLATWGISLFLIQLVRQIFGAQNVEVSNPTWLSGGVEVWNIVMPLNRIAIIVFAALVLIGIWLLISQTRLGLFIRSVTQNRSMAACVGVNTAKVDMLAFGLGSGIAGLAGVALSQIGNVGPDLGQAYIIDSFMVVVLGGVGQLAGTVYAALGLGVFSKFIEPGVGAVLTKIIILVFIIAVIQKRPQGLFALKGRSVEG